MAMGDAASFSRAAFASPAGVNGAREMNRPESRRLSLPSKNGIGTARALGRFYATLANGGSWRGESIVPPAVVESFYQPVAQGEDKVLLIETAYANGMMKDPVLWTGEKTRSLMGPSPTAFGHAGAGGSHAFADPEHGIGFAYTMNRMQAGVLPNERARGLVRALYAEL